MQVEQTAVFVDWLLSLDKPARMRITFRLDKLAQRDIWGDHKPVGGGVIELREHFGPGYRIYVTRRGATLVIALGGGDKSSQARDIARAIEMVERL